MFYVISYSLNYIFLINIVYLQTNLTKYVETCITYSRICWLIRSIFMRKAASQAWESIRKHPHRRQQSHAQTWHTLRAEHGRHGAKRESPRKRKKTPLNPIHKKG